MAQPLMFMMMMIIIMIMMNLYLREMVCLRNMCINTLHKEDSDDDDDDDNNNNNNLFPSTMFQMHLQTLPSFSLRVNFCGA
jgi:hypothetical protein